MMLSRKKILLSILFAIPICFAGSAQTNPVAPKIDSLLTYYASRNAFMGAAALSQDGKILFKNAYGFSDVANNRKANNDTQYKIGSITKMFTAAVILQLIEQNQLTAETKLSDFFPQVPNADRITIDMLLSHRSGIFNFTNDPKFPMMMHQPQTRAALVSMIASYPVHFEPDSRAEYSNSNYILLGFIIEDITKKSYGQNINERIIQKLQLKRTSYGSLTNTANNEAVSYSRENNIWKEASRTDNSLAGAAGAIISTATDLTAFITALFEGRIISKNSLSKMIEIKEGYGRGMFQAPYNDQWSYGHNGGIEEFQAMLYYLPKDKLAIAVVANAKGEHNNDIGLGMLDSFYGRKPVYPNLDFKKVEGHILKTYDGLYAAADFPLKITIKTIGNELTAVATGQRVITLDAVTDTEFHYKPAGLVIHFEPGKLILKQGGGIYTLTKE